MKKTIFYSPYILRQLYRLYHLDDERKLLYLFRANAKRLAVNKAHPSDQKNIIKIIKSAHPLSKMQY